MNINKKYKDPKNLQELIEDFEIEYEEFEEFKKWIKEIPYNYRWWFDINERHIFLKYITMGQAFYPHGLKYNGELLLYLLTHGFEKFFKKFFRNYTEANPDKFTIKQILQNKIDEIWFQEDKNKNEYEISKELRVYLDDTNFKEINKLDSKEGEKLLELCKKEPDLIKATRLRNPKNYYFVIELLSEIAKVNDKKLLDRAKLQIGKIFINEKYSIYNKGVAGRYFKELADDESSQLRIVAASLFAKTINWNNSNKRAEKALEYFKIASADSENASIFYMIGLIYHQLKQDVNAKEYFRKAADLNLEIAIKKCKELNISFE